MTVVIKSTMNLIGEDKETTIIQSSSNNYGIYCKMNWIDVTGWTNITGFTIKSAGMLGKSIRVDGYYINIYENIINSGVTLGGSVNKIINNDFVGSQTGIEMIGNYNTVSDNLLSGTTMGISMSSSNENTITDNIITNAMFGMILTNSINNQIRGNVFTKFSWYGLYISSQSTNNVINENSFTDAVSTSTFGYGIYIMSSSNNKNNLLYHNNFINNIENAYDGSSNTWYYNGEGNYWDDYSGSGSYTIPPGNNKDLYPLSQPYG